MDESTFFHTLRVRDLALRIARQENADLKVVELAALLHDVGKLSSSFKTHHLKSAEMADSFLKENGVDPETRVRIVSCVKTHMAPRKLLPEMIKDFKEDDFPQPISVEEKCIHDADMLELLGALGLVKILNICLAERHLSLAESVKFAQWLMKGAGECLFTEVAKRVAGPLVRFQNSFFELYKKQFSKK